MGIVSDIETYFVKTGKIRDYTSRVANNSEVISIQIPVPATGLQQIYLPQNTLLDSHKLRAIQIIADDEQFYGFTSRGTTVENLPVTSLPNFVLALLIPCATAMVNLLHLAVLTATTSKASFNASTQGRLMVIEYGTST